MTYYGITTDRQFKTATGYSKANFEKLLSDFQMKNDMMWDSLGVVFGMSGTSAHDNFKKYASMLARTLSKKT
jgi:hypothetical protein